LPDVPPLNAKTLLERITGFVRQAVIAAAPQEPLPPPAPVRLSRHERIALARAQRAHRREVRRTSRFRLEDDDV
jgi:hypothetical protein